MLTIPFLDYLGIAHDNDFGVNVCSGQPLSTLPMEALREEIESITELMRHGFAASGPTRMGRSR